MLQVKWVYYTNVVQADQMFWSYTVASNRISSRSFLCYKMNTNIAVFRNITFIRQVNYLSMAAKTYDFSLEYLNPPINTYTQRCL